MCVGRGRFRVCEGCSVLDRNDVCTIISVDWVGTKGRPSGVLTSALVGGSLEAVVLTNRLVGGAVVREAAEKPGENGDSEATEPINVPTEWQYSRYMAIQRLNGRPPCACVCC